MRNSNLAHHINQKSPGSIFSAKDFLKLAQRNTIDQTLLRLSKRKYLLRVGSGLYSIPIKNPIVGDIPPSVDDLVHTYAQKLGYKIQVSPAKAANILGLSLQVPAKHVYLTDGPTRSIVLGGMKITLKHVCPKKLIGIGTTAGLLIQALYYYGKTGLPQDQTLKVKHLINDTDKDQIKNWMGFVPLWMQNILREILDV